MSGRPFYIFFVTVHLFIRPCIQEIMLRWSCHGRLHKSWESDAQHTRPYDLYRVVKITDLFIFFALVFFSVHEQIWLTRANSSGILAQHQLRTPSPAHLRSSFGSKQRTTEAVDSELKLLAFARRAALYSDAPFRAVQCTTTILGGQCSKLSSWWGPPLHMGTTGCFLDLLPTNSLSF
jgi:hypothetical protein